MTDKQIPNEKQIIAEVFSKLPSDAKPLLKEVPYAFSLCMASPNKTVRAQLFFQEEHELYLTLWMAGPDDFLLQVGINFVASDYWLRGNMEQMTRWLEALEASAHDEMLWEWEMYVQVMNQPKKEEEG